MEVTAPFSSPQLNGMAEAFVRSLREHITQNREAPSAI